MCSRGVFQLRKIQLQFCDFGGSSKGVRDFLNSDTVKEFMVKNPQIQFEFIMRRNKHPFLSAQYINGFVKDVSLKNYGGEEILDEFNRVRQSFGRKSLPFAGKKLYTSKPSIQGKWTPLTWSTYPKVELQMVREIKEPQEEVQLVDNINKNVELVNYKDFVHAFLKEKKINEEFNSQIIQ
ncbi:hypothetical protein ABPG74_010179 [Tetrahymena malaccensis]